MATAIPALGGRVVPRRGSALVRFVADGVREVTHGSAAYHLWMALLTLVMLAGAYAYSVQLREGLVVTGMHDHVSWGLYISSFTFLVGVAAAAVILVMPTYVLHDHDFKSAVLFGEGIAVAALVTAIGFVVVDVGGPDRLWHLVPGLGLLNWPRSMLAWDILVLNGYLALNLLIPFYILFSHYRDREPNPRLYVPAVLVSILWAVSLHLVTAFLYAGLPARPYWNSALLGPRFLATAFAAGPALMIIILALIRRHTEYSIPDATIQKLALVVTVAAQVCLVILVSELFTEFYRATHHAESARYLYFGLEGHRELVPWIWTAVGLTVLATAMLSVHAVRRTAPLLYLACAMLFVGILIDKGIGTIIPGFVPEPWGRIPTYSPTWVELTVSGGLWALGAFVFTMLAKAAIAVEVGRSRWRAEPGSLGSGRSSPRRDDLGSGIPPPPRRPRRHPGRGGRLHVRVREGLLLSLDRPPRVRELPHHERAVRGLAQERPPAHRDVCRVPPAPRGARQVGRQGGARVPALGGLHLAELQGADRDHGPGPASGPGKLRALSRRLRARRAGDGDASAPGGRLPALSRRGRPRRRRLRGAV